MSYNISSFTVLEIKGLTIPADICRKHNIKITFAQPVKGYIPLGEYGGVQGTFDETLSILNVNEIDCVGEGSGRDFDKLKEFLAVSKGTVAAFQIWEGGDRITMLICQDGKVESFDVDLAKLLTEKYHINLH